MTFEYHVSPRGNDFCIGTAEEPFRTISQAARVARPGDTVIVHEGVYREQVDPLFGGISEFERITYCGASGESRPIIKGSERIRSWKQVEGHPSVWSVTLDNSFFGEFNPFDSVIAGDWLEKPKKGIDPDKHLGDVYLNGRSFYEVESLEQTYEPQERFEIEDFAIKLKHSIDDPLQTLYVWYAEVDHVENVTRIWANFQGADPNEELVEISVRRSCFFPSRNHIDFITVRGFEMAQATGDWAPPTSPQYGMVGPNWAYGWIIEDNVLHDVKFSAVSLGKESASGNNEWMRTERKSGYQYQLEAVFKARRLGWKKDVVGSHIVRNNDIYHCGQNAIVGHMGCAFSKIEHNHIHHIASKQEFFGWEVAGIKFHAAIDTVIQNNYIHDCSLGMWMDWQTQGTRITRNIMRNNVRDAMIEVSHGPYLVDNNIFASDCMFQNWSQGGAFVNNIICGGIEVNTVPDRSTPYHFAHSTEVAGCAVVSGGDERWLNNVFAPQRSKPYIGEFGLSTYADCPTRFEEYLDNLHAMWADPSQGGGERNPLQPVYAGGNVFMGQAEAGSESELGEYKSRTSHDMPYFGGGTVENVVVSDSMAIAVVDTDDGVFLDIDVPHSLKQITVPCVTSEMLGMPRIVEERYESYDGKPYVLNVDLLGNSIEGGSPRSPGALELSAENEQRIKVWEWN
ncbi:MAG: right-handed parallel beta-helix repeat-containing protein [Bifidobacterium tsurumiense]|uniref:right-handed parallel beta-helix repeat-containing protein n=1 Tax=Bifidobacterium tsurumiense TaxID=356829 RepID=UPI002A82404C|nr:right-handed parallel beta-helix repeat-containing protein [Bifidobacterium tsurumiense]MDY4677720.1 right-handed parallel beta-helix repeat-containing protein [Bifidobacterium tsurumiense]